MSARHTPGPWRLGEDAQGPCMVLHPTLPGVAIANLGTCFTPTNGYHENGDAWPGERNANARLIAASPTMYAFIEKRAEQGDTEAKEILEAVNAAR